MEDETVYVNAEFVTLSDKGSVGAVAVSADGRITAVGSAEELQKRGGKVVDLGGKTVLPGFVDSHVHLMLMGESLLGVDCSADIPDVVARLTEAASRITEPKEGSLFRFVVGYNFDETCTSEGRPLSVSDLDAIGDLPVLVWHSSFHAVFVNSRALELAGIDETVKDPPGGEYVRDKSGKLTGELKESQTFLPIRALMAPGPGSLLRDEDMLVRCAWAAAMKCRAAGITCVHDMLVPAAKLAALKKATEDPDFPVRVVAYVTTQPAEGSTRVESVKAIPGTEHNERLKVGGVKLIVDGALLLRTAALREPYLDGKTGELTISEDMLEREFKAANARRCQLAVHCNGDASLEATLNAAERAGEPTTMHRIEHLQVSSVEQVERVAKLGMGISLLTGHMYTWGEFEADRILQRDRVFAMYRGGTAERLGITLGIHSDAPVTVPNPLKWMWATATRTLRHGTKALMSEAVSLPKALRASTIEAAMLGHDDHRLGSLEVGKLADMVVLGGNPLTVPEDEVLKIPVVGTVLGGKYLPTEHFQRPME
eukprot:Sspe_Gene.75694::Locus_47289_Transcript_1_1_Confidence_1.000_Length_1801::g.75694::m.75694